MPRGNVSELGTERVAKNGYRYRKTEEGWVLIHRLIAEENLGRPLGPDEYATFGDGDKTNLKPSNIVVRTRGQSSLRKRLAQVEQRLEELTRLREHIIERLKIRNSLGVESIDEELDQLDEQLD